MSRYGVLVCFLFFVLVLVFLLWFVFVFLFLLLVFVLAVEACVAATVLFDELDDTELVTVLLLWP
jgi:hypothetical protein